VSQVLGPGWADNMFPKRNGTGEESDPSDWRSFRANGKKPFRIDWRRVSESARKGGQKGRRTQWGAK
jgi:hypothetical protein